MTNDRELLEMAAKAMGIELQWPFNANTAYPADQWWKDATEWNPLTDDGDALRLAVKLGLNVRWLTLPHATYVEVYDGKHPSVMEPVADVRQSVDSPLAATRRAITRAAAEIGRVMK